MMKFLKNLFKKPSLEFISLVPGLANIKELQPKLAKDFIPQWWKNLPSTTDERDINTFKKCPVIPELYDRGYILPLWTDLYIRVDKESVYFDTPHKTELSRFGFSTHPMSQLSDHLSRDFHSKYHPFMCKAAIPWRVMAPKGWSIFELPLFWEFNKWTPLVGTSHTDIFFQPNVNFVLDKSVKELTIPRGTPFAWYVPFKRNDKLPIEIRELTPEDDYKIKQSDLHILSKWTGGYKKLRTENEKPGCPFGFDKIFK